MKKAQGLSLNVIIVAVIALVVLIVLVVIFSGRAKFFSTTTSETAGQFTGDKCEIPGTLNYCMGDDIECRNRGGTFREKDFDDCRGGERGCCFL